MPPRPRAMAAPLAPRLDDGGDEVHGRTEPVGVLESARLVGPDLAGTRVNGLRWMDVAVERGNLANLVAPELSLRRVTITGARLTGAQWTRAALTDVTFSGCRMDLATLAGATLERVAFEDSMLVQADFREALLRSVRFEACDLTEADLAGLRIDRCELRGCTLDGVSGVERLRGAAMPWADIVGHAELLAAALGIRVLDEELRGGGA